MTERKKPGWAFWATEAVVVCLVVLYFTIMELRPVDVKPPITQASAESRAVQAVGGLFKGNGEFKLATVRTGQSWRITVWQEPANPEDDHKFIVEVSDTGDVWQILRDPFPLNVTPIRPIRK